MTRGEIDVKSAQGPGTRGARPVVWALALLTGLGLFFVAGMHEVGSWLAFAGATVVALLTAESLTTAPVRFRGEDLSEPLAEPNGPQSVPSSAGQRPSEAPLGRGPDDIDYLRALRHEFRTPLNAVLGFADVLLSGIDGEVNASQREDLEIIRASGIRLRILLDSALDISQLAEGELRLDLDRVDIGELVGRAAREAGQLWSNKRLPDCILPEGTFFAAADEGRLRRSVLVLADFLATSHRDANIRIALRPSEDHLAIELTAEPAERQSLDALPTTAEVLAAEDATTIRQWPVAVTSELIGRHGGSLYHGSAPVRFRIRLSNTESA